jgi:hypothetical protein
VGRTCTLGHQAVPSTPSTLQASWQAAVALGARAKPLHRGGRRAQVGRRVLPSGFMFQGLQGASLFFSTGTWSCAKTR